MVNYLLIHVVNNFAQVLGDVQYTYRSTERQLLQHQLNQATIGTIRYNPNRMRYAREEAQHRTRNREAELESWVQREGGLRKDEQQLEVRGR